MKYYLKLIFSCCLIVFTFSCNKNIDNFVSKEGHSFSDSRDLWNELKMGNGNSYKYSSRISSVFGFGSITEMIVNDGKVTGRNYQEFTSDVNTGELINTDVSYIELNDEVGNNERGFGPFTIDQLYDSCASEYLTVSASDNFITFETTANGLVETCSYFPKECQDDCSIGFTISSFMFL